MSIERACEFQRNKPNKYLKETYFLLKHMCLFMLPYAITSIFLKAVFVHGKFSRPINNCLIQKVSGFDYLNQFRNCLYLVQIFSSNACMSKYQHEFFNSYRTK